MTPMTLASFYLCVSKCYKILFTPLYGYHRAVGETYFLECLVLDIIGSQKHLSF